MEPAIPSPQGLKRDAFVVATSSAVLLASAILGQFSRHGIWLLPSRSICWSQLLLNRACPGCGLSRSFVALGGGDLRTALALNPAGPALYLIVITVGLVHASRFLLGVPSTRRADVVLAAATALILLIRTIAFYFFAQA